MKRKRIECVPAPVPEGIRALLDGAALYDSSSSDDARVFLIERDGGLFLKRAAAGSLAREARMTEYFSGLGLTGEVLFYASEGGRDFLLTRRVPGEDCVHPDYLADPERLTDLLGERLRALHGMNASGCPGRDRADACAEAVREGIRKGNFTPKHWQGLWDFSSPEEARKEAERGIAELRSDVLIHGDYCLPNVVLDRWRFSGFVDLGLSGTGDRHVDLAWGIWSLRYNLGTDRYTERFLDAYGRDAVEADMLRLVAAMDTVSV